MFETKPEVKENQAATSAQPAAFQEWRKEDKKPAKCPTCGRDNINT